MKKIVSLLVTLMLLCTVLCVSAQAASGDVLLDHNFEDGKTPFGSVDGTVEVVEEKGNKIAKIVRNADAYSATYLDIDPVADFDLSMRVRLDKCHDEQWNWVKLCFRSPDYNENNSYHMHLYTSRVEFAAKGGQKNRNEMQPVVTNESMPIRLKNWYTVEIFARGDKMTAYINGKKLLEMTDTDFSEGGFALASWGWDYSVDDIKVTERSASDSVTPTFKAPTTGSTPSSSAQSSSSTQTASNNEGSSQQTATPSDTSTGSEANGEGDKVPTDNATADNNTADNSGTSSGSIVKVLGIIAIVVVVAIGAVTVVYIVKNMPKAPEETIEAVDEDEAADEQES